MDSQWAYYRDTWAEINLDHISYNIEEMRRHIGDDVKVFAVVKANAYGHGDEEVAREALNSGVSYLAVAFLDEALALRNKGISAPILVLGISRPEDVRIAAENQISLTVFQQQWLREAKELLPSDVRLAIHVKLDTGMGRLGVRNRDELKGLETLIKKDPRFNIEGVYTHFATADELDFTYFERQMERFKEMVSWFEARPEFIHTGNSAAALIHPESHHNAVRMGISMYGLTPSPEIEPVLPFRLKPAFSLHTKLVHVKKISKGERISYGATYEGAEDEWIGTLPIGYADGWIRKLQGQEVLVEGQRVPIVGRICMDQCMVRLPRELPIGTVVTLIGRQGESYISVNEVAEKLQTINYEITCMAAARIPRVYMKNGKVKRIINSLLKQV
ncbi:alanine racemase [Cytobacillus massiliigabonensis]|uniref:alanine racemase n=1 Tax=Cytobacillus massiliigabonensis TaxID=1871011 RepID=UPI001F1EE4F6|nr:alanine racemase [Cytobacillus massiliigabonensis]